MELCTATRRKFQIEKRTHRIKKKLYVPSQVKGVGLRSNNNTGEMKMKQILRVALMVLLAAVTSVGIARGEWKDYTPGTPGAITWQYEEVDATSCRIKPKDTATVGNTMEIPATVGSLTVVEIAKSAFEKCRRMTGVAIPNSVTMIEAHAFFGCSGLTGVTIPGSVTEIGRAAFYDCSGLTSVTIPGSVTEIGGAAFFGCSGLTSVTIPGSVTEIQSFAFDDCSGLAEVTIQRGVTKIGMYAFRGCIRLKEVTIPSSVTEIQDGAFENCWWLTSVTIPGSVTEIGVYAFFRCSGLTSVSIPGSVTEIGGAAFSGCSRLTAVTIQSGVTSIGEEAFWGCKGLTAVTIPSSVTEIGGQAFDGCKSLNTVYWLADANCRVEDDAFDGIASPATLYVRKGEKAKIEVNGQKWWGKFTIVEGNVYVVTFKDGEGNKLGEQLVEYKGTVTESAAPTKKGFTIVEWQLDGKKYEFSTKVTKDITLVAVWKKKEESAPNNPETAVESVQLAGVRVVRNPVGEALELEGMERAARVEVYSVVGARVHAEALRGEPRVTIDARGWVHGVYVVRVEASDGERTLRVVK